MLSLGLDLSAQPARAVVVDERGQVVARATGATGSQAARAAAKGQSPGVAGSAHVNRGETDKISVPGLKSITRCAAGAAAMAAEAWIGAARGTRHAICLCIGDEVYAGVMAQDVLKVMPEAAETWTAAGTWFQLLRVASNSWHPDWQDDRKSEGWVYCLARNVPVCWSA